MKHAFTLIELLVVVAIMAIVGTLSTGWYSRYLVQNEVDTTTDRIVQSLRKAQYYSVISRKSNTNMWGVSYTGGVLKLFQSGNSALDENYTINGSVSVTGLSTVQFSRLRGLPSPSTPLTITVSGQNTTRTITVNSEGGISR